MLRSASASGPVRHPAAVGGDPAALAAIRSPGISLAIWERAAPPSRLADLDLDEVDDVALTIDAHDAVASVSSALEDAGYPTGDAAWLSRDIADLARRFGALGGGARLRLRLDVVESDACRRFHADYVTVRLLCAYVGRGAEWREAEGDAAVRSVATGAAAIFKGRRLIDDPAILHRSPPIAAAGERRLLLVVDPVLAD